MGSSHDSFPFRIPSTWALQHYLLSMTKLPPILLLAGLAAHSVASFHSSAHKRALSKANIKSCSSYQPAARSLRPTFLFSEESNDDTSLNTPTSSGPSKPFDAPIDPLFKAVTRMDESTANAKTMQIPFWGELILDKSLFVLLPIGLFAILGIVSSVFVLLNSTDEFATAIQDQAAAASSTDLTSTCRGLCSDDNIDSLRQYMMGISGKTPINSQ